MKKKVNLSDLPAGMQTGEDMVNYMLDNGDNVLVNDYGSGVEYAIDDVIPSEAYLLYWYKMMSSAS